MAENFPNLKNEIDMQAQKEQKVPNKMNTKRPMSRQITIKMAKVKLFFVAEGVFFSCERGGLAEVSRLSVSGVRCGYEKKVRKRYVM